MNRFFSLLAGGAGALAFVWGCGTTPAPSPEHEDGPSSGGKGAAPSSGGSSGIGSGGTTGGGGPVTGGTGGTGNVGVGGASGSAGSAVAAGGVGATVSSGGVGAFAGGVSPSGGVGAVGGSVSPSGGIGAGGTAGSGTSGSAGTGSTDNPAGYWTYNDWHGCAWTGVDTDTVATVHTTIMPKDFTAGQAANGSYCVSGSVGNTYESVGLLGFNLAQPAAGTSCVYDPAAASSMGPPGVAMSKTGIAVNFSKTGAFTLRVQVQGPNGATDANNRWCATITDAAGPVFIPWTSFYTSCWETDAAKKGTQFTPSTAVSAVVFTVPGVKDVTTMYNFCINGFAAGDSAADAPTGGMMSGPLMGTIGGPGGTDLDFQRVKVKVNGHSYIIQNNNWGNPGGSNQTLTYKDNSFKVTQMDGTGSSAPASFPSIYIGANGDTQGGTYSTSSDDHLPKQLSAITSLMTTFKFTTTGNMNAAYDIWFSSSVPTTCYGDGISGFIMLWFHSPNGFSPIGGSAMATNVPIGGSNWNVWKGNRGTTGSSQGSCSVQNSNAPVISYVATSDMTNVTNFDLKPFFNDAVTSRGFNNSFYLTDLFAGFEIWSGGTNAEVKEFSAVVAP
jgi:hypothetical protein